MRTILFLLFTGCVLHAQSFPDFKSLRYDENYEALKQDTVTDNWYKTMKYLPLSASGTTYLSFGGDIRYQYFYVRNETWGDDPKDSDGYILNRLLLHADFHSGKYFRAFVQLQGSNADGRINPSPVDRNPLELHQGLVDWNAIKSETNNLTIRLGRQELSYGSQRLIAVREGPNNRHSFDAAKIIFAVQNYRADLFYGHYVVAEDGLFDDNSNDQKQLWGSYFTAGNIPYVKNIDWYYLGYQRQAGFFEDGGGKETRHSIGTRLWGKYKDWRYDGEAVYQFGKFASGDIAAWTVSLNTGYRFASAWLHPEIGLKTEVISGDKRKKDGELGTFNPLFPRGGYFGLASVIGPSNLIDVHPSLKFELSETLEWIIDYDMFWRYSSQDGIYGPNVAMIYPGSASNEKSIGRQLESEIVFEPNQYLYFRVEATWFEAGDFLQSAGSGKNIFFTGATIQLHF